MDKYEYNVKSDQIKKLFSQRNFAEAARIADEIDWYKVKDNAMITRVADIYEAVKEYDKAREILLIAYERSPLGRQLAYRLTILALRRKDFEEADEFYQDFVEMSPTDVAQYLLKYRIARAKGEHVDVLISILEAYVDVEMDERWQYELAKLYHEGGYDDKCIAMCDDLVLWFNEGKYVEKAKTLKKMITGVLEEYKKIYSNDNILQVPDIKEIEKQSESRYINDEYMDEDISDDNGDADSENTEGLLSDENEDNDGNLSEEAEEKKKKISRDTGNIMQAIIGKLKLDRVDNEEEELDDTFIDEEEEDDEDQEDFDQDNREYSEESEDELESGAALDADSEENSVSEINESESYENSKDSKALEGLTDDEDIDSDEYDEFDEEDFDDEENDEDDDEDLEEEDIDEDDDEIESLAKAITRGQQDVEMFNSDEEEEEVVEEFIDPDAEESEEVTRAREALEAAEEAAIAANKSARLAMVLLEQARTNARALGIKVDESKVENLFAPKSSGILDKMKKAEKELKEKKTEKKAEKELSKKSAKIPEKKSEEKSNAMDTTREYKTPMGRGIDEYAGLTVSEIRQKLDQEEQKYDNNIASENETQYSQPEAVAETSGDKQQNVNEELDNKRNKLESTIEIFEFDKSKEGTGKIGDELTKTAEIDIDEIAIQLNNSNDLYNTANIQAALAESMEKLMALDDNDDKTDDFDDEFEKPIENKDLENEKSEDENSAELTDTEVRENEAAEKSVSEEKSENVEKSENIEKPETTEKVSENAETAETASENAVENANETKLNEPETTDEKISESSENVEKSEVDEFTEEFSTVIDSNEPTKIINRDEINRLLKADKKKSIYKTAPLPDMLDLDEDGQISIAEEKKAPEQVEGQMDFDDVMEEMEKTKEAEIREAQLEEQRRASAFDGDNALIDLDGDGEQEEAARREYFAKHEAQRHKQEHAAKAEKNKKYDTEEIGVELERAADELKAMETNDTSEALVPENGEKPETEAIAGNEADVENTEDVEKITEADEEKAALVAQSAMADLGAAIRNAMEEDVNSETEAEGETGDASVVTSENTPAEKENTSENTPAGEIENTSENAPEFKSEIKSEIEPENKSDSSELSGLLNGLADDNKDKLEEASEIAAEDNKAISNVNPMDEINPTFKADASENKSLEAEGLENKAKENENSEDKSDENYDKYISKDHKIPENYRRVFNDFVNVGNMEEEISDVLDNLINKFDMDGTSRTNNVVITGSSKIGKTTLGLSLIKAANRGRGRAGRRVAKVKATVLNKRGVALAMTQILGTDLIIEQAGNLMPNTIVDLTIAMKNYTEEMLVILEDDKAAIDRMFENRPELNDFFTNRLDISEMEIPDMVRIAKEYANDNFYEIDEIGELALSAKLDDLAGQNPVVSIEDIQEVVDAAIEKANKFSLSKIFGKKKSKNEMTILSEEDFL